MKKTNFLALLALTAVMLTTGCNQTSSSEDVATSEDSIISVDSTTTNPETTTSDSTTTPVVALGKVQNIKYEEGVLSFDPVENATGYDVTITRGEEEQYQDRISKTTLNIEALGLEGNLTVSVYAYNKDVIGETSTFDFTVLSLFGEVIIEAEDNLYNFGTGKEQSNFRNNIQANAGAYVGGIDDCGQGIYINYLSPVAGTFDFDLYYTTGMPTSRNDVRVNNAYADTFECTVNTGWGGDTYNAEKATISITLNEGWNTISVMKNGVESNNWGNYTELDYFVINGNGEEYNASDLEDYGLLNPVMRLEAEMGSPRKKQDSLFTCKNPCIVENETQKYSNGFLMGGIEQTNDGVEWHFFSDVAAKFEVTIGYACGEFEGSTLPKPQFVVTPEAIALSRSADFADYESVVLDGLSYTGWNNVAVSTTTVEIEVEVGENFIYCLKGADSGIFQLDYADLELVEIYE